MATHTLPGIFQELIGYGFIPSFVLVFEHKILMNLEFELLNNFILILIFLNQGFIQNLVNQAYANWSSLEEVVGVSSEIALLTQGE